MYKIKMFIKKVISNFNEYEIADENEVSLNAGTTERLYLSIALETELKNLIRILLVPSEDIIQFVRLLNSAFDGVSEIELDWACGYMKKVVLLEDNDCFIIRQYDIVRPNCEKEVKFTRDQFIQFIEKVEKYELYLFDN